MINTINTTTNQEQAYPLSSLQSQRQKLAGQQHYPYSPTLICAYTWSHTTDEKKLKQALQKIIDRHEALRTKFVDITELDQPLQQVTQDGTFSFCTDHTSMEALYQQLASEPSRTPLSHVDITLWKTSEKNVIAIKANADFIDRPSLDLIIMEMATICDEQALSLDPEPIQYIDYIDWQSEWMEQNQTDTPNKTLYTRLAIDSLTQYSDKNDTKQITHCVAGNLDKTLFNKLQQIASRYQLSVETTLFCNWQLLLQQLADNQAIHIGWYSNGRNVELESSVGVFECHLPIESDTHLSTVVDLLISNEKKYQQTLHNQFLIHWDQCELSPLLFEYQKKNNNSQQPLWYSQFFDGAHLKLVVRECNNTLECSIVYDNTYYNKTSIDYITNRFHQILHIWCDNPETRIDNLNYSSERSSIFFGKKNDTSSENIITWFEKNVSEKSNYPALYYRDIVITYKELDKQVNRLANYLIANGSVNGSAVGIYSQRSEYMLISILAVLKTGKPYVALDPNYPEQRLTHIINNSQLKNIIICEKDYPEFLHDIPKVPCGETRQYLHLYTLQDKLEQYPDTSPVIFISSLQTAYILYTSGSTGLPKGVSVNHGNLASSTKARKAFYPGNPSCFLLLSSFAFDSSVAGIFWTLCSGGALCLPKPSDELNVLTLATLMHKHEVSHFLCLPALYRAMLDQHIVEDIENLDSVILAGEACPPSIAEKHSRQIPSVLLTNEYGPTESTVWCSAYSLDSTLFNDKSQLIDHVPIGQAIAGTGLYVLDNHQQTVAAGVSGELYIGGDGVTQGYLGQPRLTAERYLPDPFSGKTGTRMYRSGDRVRIALDQNLEFLGRVDNQVKIRGHRIEPEEIERHITNHPQIQNSVVITVSTNEDNHQLAAFIQSNQLSKQDCINHLEKSLPNYMIPMHWIMIEQLPTSANGKIDRQQFASLFIEQSGVGNSSFAQAVYRAPRTDVEKILCSICADLMKKDQVGIQDNFFHLGGDSILSLQLIARAANQGVEITPQELFENPVLADAAQMCRTCIPTPDKDTHNTSTSNAETSNATTTMIDVDLSDDEFQDLLSEIE